MEKSYSESYAAAGVDITAGYRSVELMKQYVARTMNEHCIGGLGGFGGLFELDCTGYKHPVLISGTDGVAFIGTAPSYPFWAFVGTFAESKTKRVEGISGNVFYT